MTNTKVYFSSFFKQLFCDQTCRLCGQPSLRDLPICTGCEQDLPWLYNHCRCCAEPLGVQSSSSTQVDNKLCGRCLKKPPAFDQTLTPLIYDFPVNWLIQNYKHRFDEYSLVILSELLLRHLQHQYQQSDSWPKQLIPVPLHPKRRFNRGFDQAAELAHRLGPALGIPVNTKACKRVLDTPQQQGLDARQRRKNLRRAFTVNGQLLKQQGPIEKIAIIDDVLTTGSTANVLAERLRAEGVKQVDVWCLARTPMTKAAKT